MESHKINLYDTEESINTYTETKLSPSITTITYKRFLDGAYVNLSIDKNIDKPNPLRNTLINQIEYTVFITYLCSAYNLQKRTYSTKPKCQDRSPRGLPRQLLCEMLSEMLEKNKIDLSDNICLYSNPSQKLVEMYSKMGFVEVGRLIPTYENWSKNISPHNTSLEKYNNEFDNSESIMIASIQTILQWCNSKYNKKFLMQSNFTPQMSYEFIQYLNNMYINISIEKSIYPMSDIIYNIKINTSDSQHNPLDIPNKLLCNLLFELLTDNIINKDDIILVEIPKNDKNVIIRYLHVGFHLHDFSFNNFKVMTISVDNILTWCGLNI